MRRLSTSTSIDRMRSAVPVRAALPLESRSHSSTRMDSMSPRMCRPRVSGWSHRPTAERERASFEIPSLGLPGERDLPADAAVRRALTIDTLTAGCEPYVAGNAGRLLGRLLKRRRYFDGEPDEITLHPNREWHGFFIAPARKQQLRPSIPSRPPRGPQPAIRARRRVPQRRLYRGPGQGSGIRVRPNS